MKRIGWILGVGLVLLAIGRFGFPILAERLMADGVNRSWVSRSKEINEPGLNRRIFGPVPEKPIKERVVQISAKPQIRNERDTARLVLLSPEGQPIEVFFSAEHSPWAGAVSKDKLLHFSLRQTKVVTAHNETGWEDFFWMSEIERISDDVVVLFDAQICPVHGTRMERGEVEIHYGLPAAEFMEALKRFSGGPGFILGGCCVEPDKKVMDYRCTDCIREYQKWRDEFIADRKETTR